MYGPGSYLTTNNRYSQGLGGGQQQNQQQGSMMDQLQNAKQGYDIYNYSQGNSPFSMFDLFGGSGGGGATGLGPGANMTSMYGLPGEGSSSLAGMLGGGGAAGGATGLGSGATMGSMYGLPAAGSSSLAGSLGGGAGGSAGGAAGIGALGAGAWLAAPIAFVMGMRYKRSVEKKHDTKQEESWLKTLTPEQRAQHEAEKQARGGLGSEEYERLKKQYGLDAQGNIDVPAYRTYGD